MGERHGQGHDDVCAHASGHLCVCACRGRFHGVASSAHGGKSRLGRMADVAVQARTDVAAVKPGQHATTPAGRRANPVQVGPVETAKAENMFGRMSGVRVTRRDGKQRREAVPADLSQHTDAELASLMIDHPDHAERIGAELDDRDRVRTYRALVDSVPDDAGLDRLGEDTLMDLFARVTATDDPDEAAMGRLGDALDRLTERQQHDARMREFVNRDPAGMSDADLDIAARHAATLDDPAALDRIYGEWDRRAQAELAARQRERAREGVPPDDWPTNVDAKWSTHWEAEATPEEQRVNELVAQGWDWLEAYADVHGQDVDKLRRQEAGAIAGRTSGRAEDAMRRQYDEHVHLAYLDAEKATSGHLLNSRGKAEGYDAVRLFSGPRHVADAYASEELQRWWAQADRLTYADFRAELVGQGGAAVRRRRERTAGTEFG